MENKTQRQEIKEALNPYDYNMIVTPKEIDDLIENMKDVVAKRNKFCNIIKKRRKNPSLYSLLSATVFFIIIIFTTNKANYTND